MNNVAASSPRSGAVTVTQSLNRSHAVVEQSKMANVSEQLVATPQRDFLSLSFEQLNQVEVRLSESEKHITEIDAQKAGEVKSKPVDFLGMSFEQLTHMPVKVAAFNKEEKKEKKEDTGKSNPTNLADVPTVFSKQALKLNAPYVGQVHSVEKGLVSDSTTTGTQTPPAPNTVTPLPLPVIAFPQFIAVSGSVAVNIFLRNSDGRFSALSSLALTGGGHVIAADVNNDNILDIIATNVTFNKVTIFLGTGIGTFGVGMDFPVTNTSGASAAVADFNKDGNLDLAITDTTGGVSILLGTGTGSFGAPTDFSAGAFPRGVVVGDFNGDGMPDLAVANAGSGNVSILLGTGTGGFSGPTNFSAGANPFAIAVGDFNGDGIQDLVVANSGTNTISILLGTGIGSFGPQSTITVHSTPLAVAVGDFNGDNRPDLVVGYLNGTVVSLLLGIGNGAFSTPIDVPISGTAPESVCVGDFNGDGKLDLATANTNSNNISVLLGNGNATFQSPVNYPTDISPFSIAVGILPAGVAGEPIHLALTNPSMSTGNITVIINNMPSDWTLNAGGRQHNGTWVVQTNDTSTLTIKTPLDFVGARALPISMHWTSPEGEINTCDCIDNIEVYSPGSPIVALPGDNLTGSKAADTFVIMKSASGIQDIIFNFDTEYDQINLIDFDKQLQFSDLMIHNDSQGNALININANINSQSQSIILHGVDAKEINSKNFVFDMPVYTLNTETISIGVGSVMPFAGVLENNGIIHLEGTLIMQGDITGTGTLIVGPLAHMDLTGHITQHILFEESIDIMQINALLANSLC